MAAPAYDKFVKTIARFSSDIAHHAYASWNGINFANKEPQIVKSYLMDRGVGVDYLNHNLSPILSTAQYEVKFASVYIHQKPRITRTAASIANCVGDTPECELGDILLVFCFLDAMKNPIHCSAVLSQAKKHPILDSLSQACLYNSDITFDMPATIWNHSVIKHPTRFLPDYSQNRAKALNFTILEKTGVRSRHIPWPINVYHTWSTTLQRLFYGDLGLPFGGPVMFPDWNCIIHDLISVGQRVIPSRTNRGNALRDVVNIFNDFNEHEKYNLEIEDGEGVSMMYVIVRDKEAVEQIVNKPD